jgi:lipopolysaccharide exporter
VRNWRLFNELKRSAFVKNVLVVMTGTAMAQVISFGLTPIVSRLYSVADFGVFGSFSSFAAIIASGTTLEYTQAVMLPKDQKDAINLFLVSCLCTSAVGCLCFLCCLIIPGAINGLMQTSGFLALTLLVAATLISGLNKCLQAWCVRVKAFKTTSFSQVVRSLSSNVIQIGFGSVKGGAVGLIVASVLADLLASLNLICVLGPDLKRLWGDIRWERMKHLAAEYIDFPLYTASQNVINVISQGLPVFLLTYFYSITVAGAYAFGVRILQIPMGFVAGALRQVLFQKACETEHQGGKLLPLYAKFTVGLFALALLPSVLFFLWSPNIFSWIFGAKWYTAGEFARSLILWMLFAFCNLPSMLFARLIRIQRAIFILDLMTMFARTVVLVLAGLYLNAAKAVFLFSLVGAIMNLLLILLVGHKILEKENPASYENWLSRLISSLHPIFSKK